MIKRDGHIRVLPLHVANKIAAGEVVERPASVVKELVENAIDAGAKKIAIAITQGGRKLVSVQDDGCGMTRDDAVLSLERQATSKILDVDDIEQIDTLGFRGEAIPSIASVSRFSITTRRADSDEGTFLQVNAGVIAEVRAAGCPVGTLVEVRDLFCNVPARRKFLRAYVTEENHVKTVFTVHALAHPRIGFTLTVDGRELYRLAPTENLVDRVRDLFSADYLDAMRTLVPATLPNVQTSKLPNISVSGLIEIPNLSTPTRRDQYVFINGRPATAPSIAYAIREAYPHRQGDLKPAAILFIDLPPNQVDVNVHPTKREVRFRDNVAVKQAIIDAIAKALSVTSPLSRSGKDSASPADTAILAPRIAPTLGAESPRDEPSHSAPLSTLGAESLRDEPSRSAPLSTLGAESLRDEPSHAVSTPSPSTGDAESLPLRPPAPLPVRPAPVEIDLPLAAADGETPKPWNWFKFLALTASGYLLIETDSGVVTINPHAARERIAFEALLSPRAPSPQGPSDSVASRHAVQSLLIPEIVKLSPPDFARVKASLSTIVAMGFAIEEFGTDTYKIDAVPQLIGELSPSAIIQTIARDLADGSGRRGGERWREELIAKSVAKSFAGMNLNLTEDGAVRLVEELAATKVPYICPRGKPIMIFTSTRELDRKFNR